MEFTKEKVLGSLASFIFVILLFSGAWYYIDQQRLLTLEAEKNAYKIKLEAEALFNKAKSIESKIKEKEQSLNNSLEEYARDKELSELTLKFIDEVSSININQYCSDDPEHNAKARKGKALLQLIEAKAREHERTDILESFVERQKHSMGGWSSKCKS
ncbi:MAG: hypothetical protein KZQ80_15740 [Candidatus Thiodiazotropha sp. (ex Monitilora ramsayi)]|nr:hypothetical protein [Candidatus Thiodiazotropha sp. (ex Monitilora ramsayi)]